MEYKTEISFKNAIIVDKEFLEELEKEILTCCANIDYSVKLENSDSIKFDSLEELLCFENSKVNKIKELTISARDTELSLNNFIYITIKYNFLIFGKYSETISGSMTTNDLSKKNNFINNTKNLFIRHEQTQLYSFVSKTGMLKVIDIAYLVFAGIYLFNVISHQIISPKYNIIMAIFVFIFILKTPLEKGQRKYFPPIVFYLGDEIKTYDEKKNDRRNFFWGFIIASLISLCSCIGGFILSLKSFG